MGTKLTNTNVDYQKHARPRLFPSSHSHITIHHKLAATYVATVPFRVRLGRAAILLVLISFFAPGINARAIHLEDEPEAVQRIYHWSGVVKLVGVIMVVPTQIMGVISLRKGKGGRRSQDMEESRQAEEWTERRGGTGDEESAHFTN